MSRKKEIKIETPDSEIKEYLKNVVGVVDATNCEQHFIWANNDRRTGGKLSWVGSGMGHGRQIGELDNMPVFISLYTIMIDNQKILFVDPTSQVVDYRMLDKWLKEALPISAFRQNNILNRVDAMNFHNVLQ